MKSDLSEIVRKKEQISTMWKDKDILSLIKKYPFGDIVFNLVGRRLRKHFQIACKKADIKNFRWHDTRACFSTNALMSGMSIAQVSTITGHKDWSQLKRYTRIKAEDLIPHVNKIVSIK